MGKNNFCSKCGVLLEKDEYYDTDNFGNLRCASCLDKEVADDLAFNLEGDSEI